MKRTTRRSFLKHSGLAAGSSALAFPAIVSGQNLNSKIRVGCIGVGGKGSSDTDNAAKEGGEIVALCDIDVRTLGKKAQKYPKAQTFADFRIMLEKMDKEIDAVTLSTPDHVHGVAGIDALQRGKHLYCQKPLTQTMWESRVMGDLAREKGVATQMGNQGSAEDGLRRAVEVIQAGVIGKPLELHVWTNRPIWPQGLARPEGEDEVPPTLDWDLWLGPAQHRPYKNGIYHSFKWRGWMDFGTGALGDMACHTVNMPFRALKLGYPESIECEVSSKYFPETYPLSSRVRFDFPEREGLPPLKFWWYEGNPKDDLKPLRPYPDLTKEVVDMKGKLPGSGCLVIGEKGKLFSADDYGRSFDIMAGDEKGMTPGDKHEACKAVEQSIPRSPGHVKEWFDMMNGGPAAYSNFDIAAYLNETILLGCLAQRVGEGELIKWDGPNMKSLNNEKATSLVKRDYREGWEPKV